MNNEEYDFPYGTVPKVDTGFVGGSSVSAITGLSDTRRVTSVDSGLIIGKATGISGTSSFDFNKYPDSNTTISSTTTYVKSDSTKPNLPINPEAGKTKKHNHYFKDVSRLDTIDIYRVLSLFGVTNPCIQHAVKKLLVAGGRGVKDIDRDIQEAIDTLVRYQEIRAEDK